MEKLEALIKGLESKISHREKYDLTISQAPVGWHIEHSLLVITQIINALERSDPKDYKWKFNLTKTFVLFTKMIPRGRVTAPKQVAPKNEITPESITKNAGLAKEKILLLQSLHPRKFFIHPLFGHLAVKETKLFLAIHTRHHLKIINDIIKQ